MNQELIDTFGTEVPFTKVSQELHALWSVEGSGNKASLMNLAVYLEDESRIDEFHGILRDITREHACRSFLVLAREGSDAPSVRSFIQAECQIRNGVKAVCSEAVTYLIDNSDGDTLRNTVFAHLDSDLPLVFWWTGELSSEFDDRLYTVFDRFLFDSSEWKEPFPSLRRILEAMKLPAARFVVHDLSWTRTHQYRLALSSIFEHPPAQEGLPSLENVEIRHCPSAETAAWLLAAWIAESLSGKLAQHGNSWKIERPGGLDLALSFTIGDCEEPVSALIFSGADQRHEITRDSGSRFLRVNSRTGNTHVENLVPADRKSPAALVAEQLNRGGANQLYLKVLNTLLSSQA